MYIIIILIILSVFTSAIPIIGTDAWFPQFIAVITMGCLAISWNLYKVSKSLGVFFAYCTFSMVFIAHFNSLSMIELLACGLASIIFLEVYKLNRFQRSIIYKVMIAVLVIQVGYGLIQKFNLDPIFKLIGNPKLCDTVGFSGSHNQYSLMMSMLSPLLFDNILTVIFVFVGLALSTSISGVFGLIGGLLFYHRSSKAIILMCAILGIVFCATFLLYTKKGYSGELYERVELWKLSARQVMSGKALMKLSDNVTQVKTCNPIFGYGMSSFFQISPYTQEYIMKRFVTPTQWYIYGHRYEHAHNDYVEILFDFGYVGLCGIGFFIFDLFTKLRKATWDKELNLLVSMLICISICALSIYTIHTAYNGMLIAVILGLLFSKLKEGGV